MPLAVALLVRGASAACCGPALALNRHASNRAQGQQTTSRDTTTRYTIVVLARQELAEPTGDWRYYSAHFPAKLWQEGGLADGHSEWTVYHIYCGTNDRTLLSPTVMSSLRDCVLRRGSPTHASHLSHTHHRAAHMCSAGLMANSMPVWLLGLPCSVGELQLKYAMPLSAMAAEEKTCSQSAGVAILNASAPVWRCTTCMKPSLAPA